MVGITASHSGQEKLAYSQPVLLVDISIPVQLISNGIDVISNRFFPCVVFAHHVAQTRNCNETEEQFPTILRSDAFLPFYTELVAYVCC